jgi:RNA polymerase sigma-70 factor, ECF subfamily
MMYDVANSLGETLPSVRDEVEREFERLLAETSTLAFRIAYSVLRQREDAEDVAQEAYMKAHRSFRRLRDRDRFRTWLIRITWRLALDRQRANRRRLAREDTHGRASEFVTPAVPLERSQEIVKAIEALPDKLRLTLVLAAVEGYDIREVARLLDVPEGTVKSRLFLARERMKEILQCANQSR